MISRFSWPAALLAILVLPIAQAAPAPAGDGMQRLESFLEQVRSMRASFRQEVRDGEGQLLEQAEGRVVLARPGRFRWDYERPHERVVMADGERLWLYEADLDQVTVRTLGDAMGETPAALLTGDRSVLERFELVDSWKSGRLAWVRLRPRATDADFAAVAVAFAGEQPAELVLDDRLGQQTHLIFGQVQLNVPIGGDSFRFVVPEGADVIEESEL